MKRLCVIHHTPAFSGDAQNFQHKNKHKSTCSYCDICMPGYNWLPTPCICIARLCKSLDRICWCRSLAADAGLPSFASWYRFHALWPGNNAIKMYTYTNKWKNQLDTPILSFTCVIHELCNQFCTRRLGEWKSSKHGFTWVCSLYEDVH